jgi:hypothetical protein
MNLNPELLKAENDLLTLLQNNELSGVELQKLKMLQILFTLGKEEVDLD